MLKSDAIKFFSTSSGVAAAAGVDPSAVSQWKTLVPEGRAMRLQLASDGALKYDPAVYIRAKELKQKLKREVIHENQHGSEQGADCP